MLRRRVLAVLASAAVLTVMVSAPALAADPVENAIASLKANEHVYVEPGTEGTSRDTVAELQATLNQDDRIVLVMLPSSVGASGNITEIAQRIDDETGHQYIIGLAVGSDTVGQSDLLPAGVASDSMSRAASLANYPVDALTTYVKVIHTWQAAHPEATPEVPTAKGSGSVWFAIAAVVLAIVAVTSLLLVRRRRLNEAVSDEERESKVKLKASPDLVRDELNQLLRLREAVNNKDLRRTIKQIVKDTESFFARSVKSSSHDTAYDAQVFEGHLQTVVKVLEHYVDIQENPRFYDESDTLLSDGSIAIEGFAEYVLTSIKRDSATALTNYRVDSQILNSQRYR